MTHNELQNVLKYCYIEDSGFLDLDSVGRYFQIADYLQIDSLRKSCKEALRTFASTKTSSEIIKLAETFNMPGIL